MCWACEEQDLMYRYELEMAVARAMSTVQKATGKI